MPVKMKPISVIKSDLKIEPGGEAQAYLTKRCADYMDRYVPLGSTGNLRRITTITTDEITYEMPYAHYQYIGKLYVDPITKKGAFYNPDYGFWSRPGAKKEPTNRDLVHKTGFSYWDKKMWSIHKSDIEDEVQKFVEKGGKRWILELENLANI